MLKTVVLTALYVTISVQTNELDVIDSQIAEKSHP